MILYFSFFYHTANILLMCFNRMYEKIFLNDFSYLNSSVVQQEIRFFVTHQAPFFVRYFSSEIAI